MHENRNETAIRTIQVETTTRPGKNRRIVSQAREHETTMDMREEMMGDNAGPTPPEMLAMAVGGCMVNIARIMAEQKGVSLDDLQVSVSGQIDPSRAMGVQSSNPTGFIGLTVLVKMKTDLADDAQKVFEKELTERCALCDSIVSPTCLDFRFDQTGL